MNSPLETPASVAVPLPPATDTGTTPAVPIPPRGPSTPAGLTLYGVEVGDLVLAGTAWREVLGFSSTGRVILGDPVNSQADGGLW